MADNKVQTNQERTITEAVLVKIKELEENGEINFPQNYSYKNALKSAQLMLTEQTVKRDNKMVPVLQVCTKPSIINALIDMTIQGLSPLKKQCYFIPMGNKLTLMKSYHGNIVATKRLKGVKNVFANIIYKDDVFEYSLGIEDGITKVIKHDQKFENIDSAKIIGAYAIVVREDEANYIEMMNMNQIRNSWSMGQGKGDTKAHNNFTDEMVKKSVINRACKRFINVSDDSDILIDAINRTKEYEPGSLIEASKKEADEEIMIEANKEELDIEIKAEDKEIVEVETIEVVEEPNKDEECGF